MIKNKTIIYNDRPIAIYNSDKKELVGIFRTPSLVYRYLFSSSVSKNSRNIYYALQSKSKIKKSELSCCVVLRYAKDDQIDVLGSEDYIVMSGYHKPIESRMKGFDSTAQEMQKNHEERVQQCNSQFKRTGKRF